jgi:[acyl-carrier-protein] S-malonyltransferase
MEPAAKGLAEALATGHDPRRALPGDQQRLGEARAGGEGDPARARSPAPRQRPLGGLDALPARQGGVEAFVELGTGKVLRGLLRTLDANAASWNVEDPESLQATRAALAGAGRTA